MMKRHAMAPHAGLRGADRNPEIAHLVMHMIKGFEGLRPVGRDLARRHRGGRAARQRGHVQGERIGEAGFERRPVTLVGRHEHAHHGVLHREARADTVGPYGL